MANAYVAGGGYTEGMPAQEENMFRRTDCHFHVDSWEFDQNLDRYKPEMTDLINGVDNKVFFDPNRHICVRGPEDRSRPDLGYAWLPEDEFFPFLELRSAAVDLRGGLQFEEQESMKVTVFISLWVWCSLRLGGGAPHLLGVSPCADVFTNMSRILTICSHIIAII